MKFEWGEEEGEDLSRDFWHGLLLALLLWIEIGFSCAIELILLLIVCEFEIYHGFFSSINL